MIFQEDFGQSITATIQEFNHITKQSDTVNLAGFDSIVFLVKKPSETIVTISGALVTDGTDGLVRATVPESTFDEFGLYVIQVRMSNASQRMHTARLYEKVNKALGQRDLNMIILNSDLDTLISESGTYIVWRD